MSASQIAPSDAKPMNVVGRPHPRVDGALKVTGTARYAGDQHLPDMLYAVPVGASIAKGRITAIDAGVAEQMPGVRAILRRGSFPPLARVAPDMSGLETACYLDELRPPFEDDVVRYYGQYVALAVADSFEQAKA
ncbi:MAG TPA: hypothetical protein VE684_06850, partial [Crenalkalicoccus sp.]|nr:hypothetical protein [Crenalkalicoccus sp.]